MIKLFNALFQHLKSKRLNVFMLFYAAAFSILIIAKLSVTHYNTIAFKVDLTNVPKDIVITNLDAVTLNVAMEATGFSWLNYVFNQPKMSLNLKEDFTLNTNEYHLNKDKALLDLQSKLGSSFKNITIQNTNFVVNFDKLSSKMVPVTQNFTINYENGFNSNHRIRTSPDSVKIIGPESSLKTIKAIETEPLVLNSLNSSVKQRVALKLDDLPNTLKVSTQNVDVAINVVAFTEGKVKIPIIIENLPENTTITFFPKEATVNYYVPLSLYNVVSIQDFKVTCDYNKISNSGNILFPELKLLNPEIKTARIKERNIEFVLTK